MNGVTMETKISIAALSLLGGLSIFACSGGEEDTPPPSSQQSADSGTKDDDDKDKGKDASTPPPTGNDEDGGGGDNADAGDGGSTDPTPAGPLTAKAAVAAMGYGFNLGQMFDAGQHAPTFANAKPKIDAYYAKGFRNVRIPVTWTENIQGNRLVNDPNVGKVNRSHNRLAELTKIIDYCLSLPGLYVVINAHHEGGLKTQNRHWVLEQLWDDISDIYHDRDPRLIYEFLNEPHLSNTNAMPAANLRNMTGKAYAKVRAREPKRIVVIGGNQWFIPGELAKTWPNLDVVGGGNDPYVMATYHHYLPWAFCGTDPGNTRIAWTPQNITDPMDGETKWANSVGKGMPLYIGEWGVGWQKRRATMDCNNVRKWYKEYQNDGAAPRGHATAVWDDGGWFKIWEHGSNKFVNNLVDCILGDCKWTGTERINGACN